MTKKLPQEKRADELIDAAMNEFVEKGYEGTTVESIAKRAGLTKGGFYHHFSGKDEILFRANALFSEPVARMAEESAAEKSPTKGLKRYIESYIAYWCENERAMAFVFLSMTKAVSDPALRGIYDGYGDTVAGFLSDRYRAAIEKGEMNAFDPIPVSVSLCAALDGILGYVILGSGLSMKKAAASLCDAFIKPYLAQSGQKK